MTSLRDAHQLTLDMALDATQFRREIGPALRLPLLRDDGGEMVFGSPGRTIAVALRQLAPRRIAAITLPRLEVSRRLDGFADEEARALLERFRRSFHRGGG